MINKFTEGKTVNCKHQHERYFMWIIKFFFGFFHLPTDTPIIVSNHTKMFHEIKTDGTDLTQGFEVKKLF